MLALVLGGTGSCQLVLHTFVFDLWLRAVKIVCGCVCVVWPEAQWSPEDKCATQHTWWTSQTGPLLPQVREKNLQATRGRLGLNFLTSVPEKAPLNRRLHTMSTTARPICVPASRLASTGHVCCGVVLEKRSWLVYLPPDILTIAHISVTEYVNSKEGSVF